MVDSHDKGRLPPGQNLTRRMPVVHMGSVPHFDRETWSLTVQGLVESPLEFSYEEFLALPRVDSVSDFHCVMTWSTYDNEWRGIPVRILLARARPLPDARHVRIYADGGYVTNLTLEEFMEDGVLVADSMNGEPLPPERGFPARLVVPGKYGIKSAKWLRTIELLAHHRPGFWESRGYASGADPFAEERFVEGGGAPE
jgi:DMSO/TMAO reductase YedYZ molybdopterin-dependent catalytic subunit